MEPADTRALRTLLTTTTELLERARWQFTDTELLAAHHTYRRAARALAFHTTRLLAEIDHRGLPQQQGHTRSDRWLTATEHLAPREAAAELHLARTLDEGRLPTVTEAWNAGDLDLARAAVVARTVEELVSAGGPAPGGDGPGPDDVTRAEELLATHAGVLTPAETARAAKAVLARLVPDPEPHHDDPATRTLTIATSGQGSETFAVLNGTLDQAGTEVLRSALEAFTPGRSEFPTHTEAQLRGLGLVALAEAALTTLDQLPTGPARTVNVTVPLTTLQTGRGTGQGDWTGPLSAGSLRRLACDATLVPVVLGTRSEPLDVGRAHRSATRAQRVALSVRDGGCTWRGCHRPPAHTEAHHIVHWADGGPTALGNLTLLCSSHHHTLHSGGWTIALDEHGIPFTSAPATIDPDQRRRYHERFLGRRFDLAG